MNEEERNICAFAVDAATERVLREALDDEEEGSVQRGDMTAAIKYLAGAPSPQVVIVDLDGTEFPAGSIHELAGVCEFGTRVITVGSNDTARLARELLSVGVDDYFPKPLAVQEIREAVAAAMGGEEAQRRLYAGRVIAFTGCGGGCGSTTLAAVTVHASAAKGNYVSALDLGRTFGALPWMIDVEPPPGLDELLGMSAPEQSVDASMIDAMRATSGPRISVYGYRPGTGVPPVPRPDAVRWLTGYLANRSHLVVVDGIDAAELLFPVLQDADERVLVYEPTLLSLNRVTQTLSLLGDGRDVILVENHTRAAKGSLSPTQVRDALAGRAPDLSIPFEPRLPSATNRGTPDQSLGRKYRKALDGLIERLTKPAVSLAAGDRREPGLTI